MTLKQRLEEAALGRYDFVMGAANAGKLLALLKAAKDFEEAAELYSADPGDEEDNAYYSCRDTLLNAIHAVEGA